MDPTSAATVALFRFGVIAELVDCPLDAADRGDRAGGVRRQRRRPDSIVNAWPATRRGPVAPRATSITARTGLNAPTLDNPLLRIVRNGSIIPKETHYQLIGRSQ